MWGAKIFLGGNFTYTGLPQPTASVSAGPQCRFLADLITYWEPFKIQLLNLVPHTVNFIYARCQGQNQLWPGLVMLQAPPEWNAPLQENFYSLEQKYALQQRKCAPKQQNFLLETFSKTLFNRLKQRQRDISNPI